MEAILATVNINIGLGKDNPVLTIRANDDLSGMVDQLISDYQLPRKVHSIIMRRVQEQLPQTPVSGTRVKEGKSPIGEGRSPIGEKKKSVSPIRGGLSTVKVGGKKTGQKQNNQNVSNWVAETIKNVAKKEKSVSPLRRLNFNTTVKQIEIKSTKSPRKYEPVGQKHMQKPTKVQQTTSKIAKLFRHLTKCNPDHVKIMSPQYINLKGLDKNLLNQLQYFFQSLQEHEFDLMNEGYFTSKVEHLGFKERLTRKEYDYCLTN